jgi:hypothetical protein
MAYKIFRGQDSILVRGPGLDIEIPEDDALQLARNLIAVLAPLAPMVRAGRLQWTAASKEEVRRMYVDEGIGPTEIGRRLGVDPKLIVGLRLRMGIAGRDTVRANRLRKVLAARRAAE